MPSFKSDRVLFIYADDDPDDHHILQEAIESSILRYEIRSVYDGDELINVLRETPALLPAFLIVDLNMPRVDGFTAIRYIKSNLKLDRIPIFTLTTSTNHEDRRKARELGVAGFYTKPARLIELKDIIEEITIRAAKFREGNFKR